MARVHVAATPLDRGWEMAETAPGAANRASGVEAPWRPASVPGTVAGALGMTFDDTRDLDAHDYWYRKRIEAGETGDVLRFEGLATLADVWIDDEPTLQSESMFIEHSVDVRHRLRRGSEIAIRFASLAKALSEKRHRPRWRATIVAQQQLRWFRTSLLGRIPAWTPPIAPVGPYRAITVEKASPIVSANVRTRLDGSTGVVEASFVLGEHVRGVDIVVGEAQSALRVEGHVARGSVVIQHAPRWWPHTHGTPTLMPVSAMVHDTVGTQRVELGATGFRTVDVDRSDGAFTLYVNGVRVFCRGACWMPLDVLTLGATRDVLRAALERVRDAGMNMLRVSGTMLYESRDFHELCDELGILVWQDFMFANMDYPSTDERFSALVRTEANQLLDRLQLSPSLAVCCGGSEVEQQAAMMGLPESEWSNSLFRDVLPSIVKATRPDLVYVPSSPTGGPLPFHVDEGVAHYYGVGAYMRCLDDARRARVRFTSECLAFANLPRDETIEALLHEGQLPTQHPRWKSRVARDRGTSWDFDDVRDHYLQELFDVDPAALRHADLARYLELGRVATGEVMGATMGEWRRARSTCAGAIVWFLRDLWEGAGWGVIDSRGYPKAPYYYLRRALSPLALLVTDEGLNGVSVHAVNDRGDAIAAIVSVMLYRGESAIARGEKAITLEAHGVMELKVDALIGRFTDVAYAYRFGSPSHDVTVATLTDTRGAVLARAFHFPRGLRNERASDVGVEASAQRISDRAWRVAVRTRNVAKAVAFDARGFIAEDDFFHVAPGATHEVVLTSQDATHTGPLSATVKPVNATTPTRVVCAR